MAKIMMRGQRKIFAVAIGDEMVSIPIYSQDKLAFYDSYGRSNNNLRSRHIWNDISGNGYHLSCNNLTFSDNSGWIYNSLQLNNESYLHAEIPVPTEFTYHIGLNIPTDGSLCMSLPGIDYIISEENSLIIKISNDIDDIVCKNCIVNDSFMQISLLYKDGKIGVYKDTDIIYRGDIPSLSNNTNLLLGKTKDNIFSSKCQFNYVLLYNKLIPNSNITANINNMYNRHINYYTNGLVLDMRGTDQLLYNGKKYIKDNSIFGNHFYTDFFFNSVNSYYNRNSYRFNGYNKITCEGRKLIYDEFTIEMYIQGSEQLLPNKTFLCGNFSKDVYGFRIGLNTLGFIIEFTSEEQTKLITYNMNYLDRAVHLAITYKDGIINMYVNGFMVKEERFNYKNFYDNFNLFLAKQDSEWDGFSGFMYSARIYDHKLSDDIIKNNFYLDRKLYNQNI